jgi:hypothetical protein
MFGCSSKHLTSIGRNNETDGESEKPTADNATSRPQDDSSFNPNQDGQHKSAAAILKTERSGRFCRAAKFGSDRQVRTATGIHLPSI